MEQQLRAPGKEPCHADECEQAMEGCNDIVNIAASFTKPTDWLAEDHLGGNVKGSELCPRSEVENGVTSLAQPEPFPKILRLTEIYLFDYLANEHLHKFRALPH